MAKPSYVFTTLDNPNESTIFTSTFAEGINNIGEVVGYYYGDGTAGNWLGFTYQYEKYSTQNIPSSYQTFAQGVNVRGQVVGWYNENNVDYAYIYHNGTYTTLQPLSTLYNFAEGINAKGDIVGYYQSGASGGGLISHGFLHIGPDTGGYYLTIDDPLANYPTNSNGTANGTVAKGTNSAGAIDGYYWDAQGLAHGFLDQHGAYATIDDPLGVGGTFLTGINDEGTIVGYYEDSVNVDHGFVYSHGESQL